MSEEEKKELEHINKIYDFLSKNPLAINVYTSYDIQCLGTVLNILSKQQKEIEKKDKIIDLMAEEILRIDTAKSKFEYDHVKKWDTEKGIKKIF